ncbi:MAG: hypothetical protein IKA23_08050 [Akkermansia sp.]|nr:hypothetical protein [Akkermansia sp.]
MSKSSIFFPAHQLSLVGNRDEFSIPDSPLGNLICQQRLVWGKVNGEIQPCILHPGIKYPDFQPAKAKEVYA